MLIAVGLRNLIMATSAVPEQPLTGTRNAQRRHVPRKWPNLKMVGSFRIPATDSCHLWATTKLSLDPRVTPSAAATSTGSWVDFVVVAVVDDDASETTREWKIGWANCFPLDQILAEIWPLGSLTNFISNTMLTHGSLLNFQISSYYQMRKVKVKLEFDLHFCEARFPQIVPFWSLEVKWGAGDWIAKAFIDFWQRKASSLFMAQLLSLLDFRSWS